MLTLSAVEAQSFGLPLVKASKIVAPSKTNKIYNTLRLGRLQLNSVTQSANPIIFFPRSWTNSSVEWALS